MTYLFDTDWIINYLTEREPARSQLPSLASDGGFISVITYGEVSEGIEPGEQGRAQAEGFVNVLQMVDVLPVDERVAVVWGDIRKSLRRRGQLIPDADLLIAATSLHHGLTLVTGNVDHFVRIEGLQLLS